MFEQLVPLLEPMFKTLPKHLVRVYKFELENWNNPKTPDEDWVDKIYADGVKFDGLVVSNALKRIIKEYRVGKHKAARKSLLRNIKDACIGTPLITEYLFTRVFVDPLNKEVPELVNEDMYRLIEMDISHMRTPNFKKIYWHNVVNMYNIVAKYIYEKEGNFSSSWAWLSQDINRIGKNYQLIKENDIVGFKDGMPYIKKQ